MTSSPGYGDPNILLLLVIMWNEVVAFSISGINLIDLDWAAGCRYMWDYHGIKAQPFPKEQMQQQLTNNVLALPPPTPPRSHLIHL